MNDPYRPPAPTSQSPSIGLPIALVLALALWVILAVLSVLAFVYVRPMFIDFDVQLPVLTRWLLHPMAPLMCFVIGIAFAVRGLTTEDRKERERIGRLAMGLGLVMLGALAAGIVVPLRALILALQ